MKRLIFKTIYIFSCAEKLAKKIEFIDGKNIITSSSVDGTKRGKSIILKSLYHSLGADCFFDEKWDTSGKVYILNFFVNDNGYYIYRCNNLFKIFNSNYELMFKTINASELSRCLKSITGFAVELPNRTEDKLEIAPPAYNYLLYFLDQDYLNGPYFLSFDHLKQYTNYKENVLLYHFGVFDSKYFNTVKELEVLKTKISDLEENLSFLEHLLDKIFDDVKDVSYVKGIDKLNKEIERYQDRYSEISLSLSNIKKDLIKLRNDKYELTNNIKRLMSLSKKKDKDISFLNNDICPYCKSHIDDNDKLLIKEYGSLDDAIILINSIESSISSIDKKITRKESEYSHWLKKLEEYNDCISEKQVKINDVIKHQGYMEVKENILNEYGETKQDLKDLNDQQKRLDKIIKQYNKSKKEINERYYELMLFDKNMFGLEEIKPKSIETITRVYKAGGSNRPITTVMWYINLIKLKNQFNSKAICFPVVFDSPNNAETDQEKKAEVYSYLVNNVDYNNQLIVSGIGYREEFSEVPFDNVIELKNDKYHLLCESDYNENFKLLKLLSSL